MNERNPRGRGPRRLQGFTGHPDARRRRRGGPDFGAEERHGPEGAHGPQWGHHAGRGGLGEPAGPGGLAGPVRAGRGGRRGGRVPRGDVRQAVLRLLGEEPMHGYQLMQAISDRSGGRWSPSPGAIYPTLNQLEDEGLVTITADSGRKLVTLTEAGRQLVAEDQENRPDPFAGYTGAAGTDLRRILHQLHAAARSVAMGGSEDQLVAAAAVLKEARRSLYLILAGPDRGDEERTTEA